MGFSSSGTKSYINPNVQRVVIRDNCSNLKAYGYKTSLGYLFNDNLAPDDWLKSQSL